MQLRGETICDYESFISSFTDAIAEMMGKDYSIRIYKIIRKNLLESDSMVLLKSGKSIAPGIELLPYYKEYEGGADILELAARLCENYRSHEMVDNMEDALTYTLDNVKGRIVYRVVNYSRNKKLLERVPHIKYLDLAVIYHCLIHNDESRISAIRITNEHLRAWGISVNDMHKLALKNTLREFPPVISAMEDIIGSVTEGQGNNGLVYSNEAEILDGAEDFSSGCDSGIYVLTNTVGIYGASCLLYSNLLKDFSARICSDIYIIPCSIHELILVPGRSGLDMDELIRMVKNINRTQLAYDEVLSDKVYYYSREYNAIMQ